MGMNGGLQLTGLSNITAGDTRGVQIAAYNYADTLRGTQIGLINAAAYRPKGVQIGFLNYSRDAQTRRYGLINLSPETRVDYMLFGGTSSKINAALRFKNKTSYRILGFGTHYMGFNSEFSGDIFYRFGQYIPLSSKWALSGDLGLYFIEIAKKKDHRRTASSVFFASTSQLGLSNQLCGRSLCFDWLWHHTLLWFARKLPQ